jgi:hypothetical protein
MNSRRYLKKVQELADNERSASAAESDVTTPLGRAFGVFDSEDWLVFFMDLVHDDRVAYELVKPNRDTELIPAASYHLQFLSDRQRSAVSSIAAQMIQKLVTKAEDTETVIKAIKVAMRVPGPLVVHTLKQLVQTTDVVQGIRIAAAEALATMSDAGLEDFWRALSAEDNPRFIVAAVRGLARVNPIGAIWIAGDPQCTVDTNHLRLPVDLAVENALKDKRSLAVLKAMLSDLRKPVADIVRSSLAYRGELVDVASHEMPTGLRMAGIRGLLDADWFKRDEALSKLYKSLKTRRTRPPRGQSKPD